MLADETVLGLTAYETPAPWEFFTARRQLGMETYDLYGSMLAPEKPATPLLTAGGRRGPRDGRSDGLAHDEDGEQPQPRAGAALPYALARRRA